MHKTIQIGNLGYSMDDRDLARLFTPFGAVRGATVCIHRNSGQSTGVGFVEMESDRDAETAIAALNGQMHCGRILSLCFSNRPSIPVATPDDMFGPVNLVDGTSPGEAGPNDAGCHRGPLR